MKFNINLNKMLKKISIIGITIAIGILSWQLNTRSEFNSQFTDKCTPDGGEFADSCCIAYNEAIFNLEEGWKNNLNNLKDQEKASSDITGDAYENLRTYNCWLEYVCKAVLYSGIADPLSTRTELGTVGTGITSTHLKEAGIGTVPGCQDPEDMGLDDSWNNFIDILNDIPIVGELFPDNLYATNKIDFIPHCMTDNRGKNTNPNLSRADANYEACKNELELRFGCKKDEESLVCDGPQLAIAQLEAALRKNHADQKARAIEKKLSSIIQKMLIMEEHIEYLKKKFTILDQRYRCHGANC
jgi:hypothetical protein